MHFYLFNVCCKYQVINREIALANVSFISTSTSIVVGVPVVHLVDLICRIYNVFEGSLVRVIARYDPVKANY